MEKRGRTENLKHFKPGESGNPNGRPRKLPALDKILADVLGDEDGDEAKAILSSLLREAKKGNVRAAEVLLDRAYGKPKQEIDQKTTVEDKRLDLTKLNEDELRILAEIQRKSGVSEA